MGEHIHHRLAQALQLVLYYYIAEMTLVGGVFTLISPEENTCGRMWAPITLSVLIFLTFNSIIVVLMVYHSGGWNSDTMVVVGPLRDVVGRLEGICTVIRNIHKTAQEVSDAARASADCMRAMCDEFRASPSGKEIQESQKLKEIQDNQKSKIMVFESTSANRLFDMAVKVDASARELLDAINKINPQQQAEQAEPLTDNERLAQRVELVEQQMHQRQQKESAELKRRQQCYLIVGIIFVVLSSCAFLGVIIAVIKIRMCHPTELSSSSNH